MNLQKKLEHFKLNCLKAEWIWFLFYKKKNFNKMYF